MRGSLTAWLAPAACQVVVACQGDVALNVLFERPIDVAICDAGLASDLSGGTLVTTIRQYWPEVATILLTRDVDAGTSVLALRTGVTDILVWPCGHARFLRALSRARAQRFSADRGADRQWARTALQRQLELGALLQAVPLDSPHTIELVLGRVERRHPGLLQHGRRVAALARLLTGALGTPTTSVLERAALVHDLFRVLTPSAIEHPGALRPEEREILRTTPMHGQRLLECVPALVPTARVVGARFERWDGGGFPDGLRADDIPLESRILAIADTFDTLRQPRAYRPAFGQAEALAELLRHRGTQFDPALVDLFVRLARGERTAA